MIIYNNYCDYVYMIIKLTVWVQNLIMMLLNNLHTMMNDDGSRLY